jgi:hypothetical protein
LPTRYVPPSGFDYPPGGFLPPGPCRSCFRPTALLGFTLRSVPLSKGLPSVTTGMHPPTVSSSTQPDCESRTAALNRGSWASTPSRVPRSHRGFSTTTAGCSPGFPPSRVSPADTWNGISPVLLPRASKMETCRSHPPAPRSLDRCQPGSATGVARHHQPRNNPSGVPAPARS